MTAQELTELLGGRWNGHSGVAKCPAHDDRRESLVIGDGEDGRVLVHCHAGCAVEAVLAAKGLTMRDLFSRNGDGTRRERHIVATYDYADEKGKLLFQVVRFEPKGFAQRRPDPKAPGGYSWNLEGVERVVYRLPELVAAPLDVLVFIVEGEKDADALTRLGLIATANPGGAGKWRTEYAACFKGRRVVVLPDNDDTGRKHARAVAAHLNGIAAETRILELPGLPAKGDGSDWLTAGGTREQLLELAQQAETWEPEKEKRLAAASLTFVRVGDLIAEADEAVEWILDGLLAAGGFSAMVAKPKVGKSTLARCIALGVARGESVLGRTTAQGGVLYLALEESRRQVKAHFKALGATADDEVRVYTSSAPVDALVQLRAAVSEHRPVLVVIDTLFRLTRVRDANDYAQVTAALDPLLGVARELGTHVMVLHHSPKGDPRQAIDAALGSTAIAGSVDTLIALRRNHRFRSIITEQREGEGFPEDVTLDFDKDSRRVSLGATRKDADEHQAMAAILEYLKGQPEPVDEPTIDKAVEGHRTTAKRSGLRSLVKEGKVVKTGEGKRGTPYVYSLPSDSCSLVPTISREQENENFEMGLTPRADEGNSCSRNSANSNGDGNEKPSFGNEKAALTARMTENNGEVWAWLLEAHPELAAAIGAATADEEQLVAALRAGLEAWERRANG